VTRSVTSFLQPAVFSPSLPSRHPHKSLSKSNPPITVVAGQSHADLAKRLARELHAHFVRAQVTIFSGQERRMDLTTSLQKTHALIVTCLGQDANNRIIELGLMADVARRAGAVSVRAVVPYLAYGRQNQRPETSCKSLATSWQSSSLEVVACLLEALPIDRIFTIDLHHSPSAALFKGKLINLPSIPIFLPFIKSMLNPGTDWVVVAPDLGSLDRANALATALKVPIARLEKERLSPDQCRAALTGGEVLGKSCVVVDDIVDSAQTLCASASTLYAHGAHSVYGCITHLMNCQQGARRLEMAHKNGHLNGLATLASLCPQYSQLNRQLNHQLHSQLNRQLHLAPIPTTVLPIEALLAAAVLESLQSEP
jgi:ribose-phosphate pyrophosphokinase